MQKRKQRGNTAYVKNENSSNDRKAKRPHLSHFLPYFWQGRGRCLTRWRYADIAFFDAWVIQANGHAHAPPPPSPPKKIFFFFKNCLLMTLLKKCHAQNNSLFFQKIIFWKIGTKAIFGVRNRKMLVPMTDDPSNDDIHAPPSPKLCVPPVLLVQHWCC